MVMGIPAGMLLDAGHLRGLIAMGTVLEVGGLFATAQCTKYWQIFLAQGICVGLGSGLLGLASVAVIPLYWKKRKMFATGIAATGGSLGILHGDFEVKSLTSFGSWHHLPPYAAPPLRQSWISLGCTRTRFYHSGMHAGLPCHHASQRDSEEKRSAF